MTQGKLLANVWIVGLVSEAGRDFRPGLAFRSERVARGALDLLNMAKGGPAYIFEVPVWNRPDPDATVLEHLRQRAIGEHEPRPTDGDPFGKAEGQEAL